MQQMIPKKERAKARSGQIDPSRLRMSPRYSRLSKCLADI
jgi:hypothetical protein